MFKFGFHRKKKEKNQEEISEEVEPKIASKRGFFSKLSKKKLLIVVGSVVLVFVIAIGVFAVGVYKYEWKDQATLKVAGILNFPAFFVNSQPVAYTKYEDYLRAYNTYTTEFYIKEEQKLDPNSKAAKDILATSKSKIKDLLVKDAIVRKEIAKRKIKYTEKDVADAFNEFIKNTGGQKEVENNLKKYYGISVAQFRSTFFMDAFLNGKLQNEITNDKNLSADAEKKAQTVLAEIKKGADFAAEAKKYSEDTQTASKGGDLGFIKKGVMVPQFEDAAYKLTVGQVSDVVKTVYGYHIIKLVEINGEERKVSHILIQARDFDWWIADQTKNAKVNYWVK